MSKQTPQSATDKRSDAAAVENDSHDLHDAVHDILIDSSPEPDRVLDVQGLNCPMPLLRAKLALSELTSGQRLLVLATDPYSKMDFEAFCAKTGHPLLAHDELEGVYRFLLSRK